MAKVIKDRLVGAKKCNSPIAVPGCPEKVECKRDVILMEG